MNMFWRHWKANGTNGYCHQSSGYYYLWSWLPSKHDISIMFLYCLFRWHRFSRLETCSQYRPPGVDQKTSVSSPTSPLHPPPVTITCHDDQEQLRPDYHNMRRYWNDCAVTGKCSGFMIKVESTCLPSFYSCLYYMKHSRPTSLSQASTLTLPNTNIPGSRRPSIMVITDQLMKTQRLSTTVPPKQLS